MLSRQLMTSSRSALRSIQYRAFSMSSVRGAEGATGAQRSGGQAAGDAFTKRERASEDKFVREKEMEKLRSLKEKIAAQKKHLDDLEGHIAEMEKDAKKD